MNFTGRHRRLVTDCCDDTTCGGKGDRGRVKQRLSVYGHGLQRGIDAISMNECFPIVSLATRAKDKRVFGVIGDTNRLRDSMALCDPFENTQTAVYIPCG
jgi:hypothetical protein